MLVKALGGTALPPVSATPPPDLEYAETIDKGHGRIEIRRLALSREIAYAITSLPRGRAGPDDLLALVRQHWSIENRLHYRRDVALREDASRIRSGNAPQARAALRNTVLRFVDAMPEPLTAIRETLAENRLDAIALEKQGSLWNCPGRAAYAVCCAALYLSHDRLRKSRHSGSQSSFATGSAPQWPRRFSPRSKAAVASG